MIFKTINNKILEQSNTFILIPGNDDDLLPLIEPKVDISDDILETTCKNMTEKQKNFLLTILTKI